MSISVLEQVAYILLRTDRNVETRNQWDQTRIDVQFNRV